MVGTQNAIRPTAAQPSLRVFGPVSDLAWTIATLEMLGPQPFPNRIRESSRTTTSFAYAVRLTVG